MSLPVTPICHGVGHGLLSQDAYGQCQIVDADHVSMRADIVESLKYHPQNRFGVKRNGQLPENGEVVKVAVIYTTKKPEKTEPLQNCLAEHFRRLKQENGIEVEINNYSVDVKDTGVGNQPYNGDGVIGAINRIKYVQTLILENSSLRHDLPLSKIYHRVIFASLESDIQEEHTSIPYDRPNIVFYEWFTGAICAGTGTGPGCQTEILHLAQDIGLAFEKGKGAMTYGKLLELLFSGQESLIEPGNEVKFSGSDWHGVVSVGKRNRASFVAELCKYMGGELQTFLQEAFRG